MFTVNRYLHNKQLVKKASLYRLHFDDFRQGHRLTPRKTAEEKKNNELNFFISRLFDENRNDSAAAHKNKDSN